MSNRQIALDTETTGLEVKRGHRLIEVACVEMLNRRLTGQYLQFYLNPERDIDEEASAVHGIKRAFLEDKPRFSEIADQFLAFIQGAELIIHNAVFDIGFLNHELALCSKEILSPERYPVIDTLLLARQRHPGQKNNLDALCKRYAIDNSERHVHGAQLDAILLARVYLAMTSGQESLSLDFIETEKNYSGNDRETQTNKMTEKLAEYYFASEKPLLVLEANKEELAAHEKFLEKIKKKT